MSKKLMKELSKEVGVTVRDRSRENFERYRSLRDEGRDPAQWLSTLPEVERKWFLAWLSEEGFSPLHVSKEFGISPEEVRSAWRMACHELGKSVVHVKLPEVLGQMQLRKEKVVEMGMEKGDPGLVWKVEKEYVDLLQNLGVIERAAEKREVTHSVSEGTQREIERMLSLKAKEEENQRLRLEVVDAEVVESEERDEERTDPQD